MKTFKTFCEVAVVLFWIILVLIHSVLSLIYWKDYSPSNDLIITFIVLGFLHTQIMIKWEIQKLKDEL